MTDKEKDKSKTLYNQMATEEAELKVEEDIGEDSSKTLSERLEDSPDLSDMQTAIANLFPSRLGNDITNKLMVGRISPDVFMALLRLLVNQEISSSDPDKPINVEETVTKNYILLSIGLDGRGRIDQIELAGASKESEELEGLGKRLFG